jgi:hypothetical protein
VINYLRLLKPVALQTGAFAGCIQREEDRQNYDANATLVDDIQVQGQWVRIRRGREVATVPGAEVHYYVELEGDVVPEVSPEQAAAAELFDAPVQQATEDRLRSEVATDPGQARARKGAKS